MPIICSSINQQPTTTTTTATMSIPTQSKFSKKNSERSSLDSQSPEELADDDERQQNSHLTEYSPIIMKNSNGLSSSFNGRETNSFMSMSRTSTKHGFNTQPRYSINLPSTSKLSLLKSSNSNINNSINQTKFNNTTSKTKRSGSLTSLLPLRDSLLKTSKETRVKNGQSSSLTNPPHNKQQQQIEPKRHKSNSLSIIDYCNILNMNNNMQMLSQFYEETEELMAKLSMKTRKMANLQKQASLSEQTVSLFGSNNCNCLVCEKRKAEQQQSNQSQLVIQNYEISPNKFNTKFSVKKFTYTTPVSQMSCLKLFNLMNTDCSINLNSDYQNKPAKNEPNTILTLPPIINNNFNTNTQNYFANGNNNSCNSPPIYDPRYLYIIDCRLNKKQYEKHRINTALHFTDLLDDTVYLSPIVENYTLIVLYDDDGSFLSTRRRSSANPEENDYYETNSVQLIAAIKEKLNTIPSKTIFILSGGYEQFNRKFSFACSNQEIRSTVDRNKYLTVYPNCVIENQLYLGSGVQAKNWKCVRDLHITHIINCSFEHECVFGEHVEYMHIKLEDNYQQNIFKVLQEACDFIENAYVKYNEQVNSDEKSSDNVSVKSGESRKSSGRHQAGIQRPVFLIHCNLGISRSSSVVIAYLMSKFNLCLHAAFKYVKDKRIQIAPNYSFLRQLKQFEETF